MLDLPQLYTQPSAKEILNALDLLSFQPRNFGCNAEEAVKRQTVQPTGVPRYLTSIIASSLSWLESDEVREAIWDVAAARLSERSGRAAMPALSRAFTILTSSRESFTLTLHEPTLTSDNLGTKTWVSSYLLSRRLHSLLEATPKLVSPTAADQRERSLQRVLELGAGTGLVGLSFAALRPSASVHLTDLPEIVPNLAYNVTLNAELLSNAQATVTTGVLDWSVPSDPLPVKNEKYDIILAADPLYSSEHPKWLVETIDCWLSRKLDSRVIVEMPLRDAYLPQVQEFRHRMIDIGLVAIENGQEVGHDDWENADGEPLEVICWWSVWAWSEKIQ